MDLMKIVRGGVTVGRVDRPGSVCNAQPELQLRG